MVIGICKECGETKEIHAYSKCYGCYKRYYKPPKTKCKVCGEVKEHHARGMCRNCLQKLFYYEKIKAYNIMKQHGISLKLWRELTKKCFLCGFDKIVDLHHIDHNRENRSKKNLIGLCPNHHKMVHDMRFKEEIERQIREELAKSIS